MGSSLLCHKRRQHFRPAIFEGLPQLQMTLMESWQPESGLQTGINPRHQRG
jgi:hypothetical protein